MLQLHKGEQNSSTDGPFRGNGGILHKTCIHTKEGVIVSLKK